MITSGAALRHLLSNHTKVQVRVIGLVLVAIVDDLPLFDAVPGVSGGADIFLDIAVGEVGVVGAVIG